MNEQQPWYYSLWFIIAMFILFWPLGLALLFMRNNGNKNTIFLEKTNKNKYFLSGLALSLIGLSSVANDVSFWGACLLIGGLTLLGYGEKLTKKAQRNRKYIELVVNQGENSIYTIASECQVSPEKALKELRYLQRSNVINNYEIDEDAFTIYPAQEARAMREMFEQQFQSDESEEIPVIVSRACPKCGARHALAMNTVVYCDYCDSPITATAEN